MGKTSQSIDSRPSKPKEVPLKYLEYLHAPCEKQERLEMVASVMRTSRERAGLSQREVCEIIDCKPQTYNGYERGKYEPTIETLVRLSWLYDISLDDLLCKHGEDEGEQALVAEAIPDDTMPIHAQVDMLRQEIQELKDLYHGGARIQP